MWLERVSGGGIDLIDLADAKAHLRLLEDDFDGEVGLAVTAASVHLDIDADGFGGLGFPIVAQQWSTKGAGFLPGLLRLPFGRVTSVDEIRFTAPDGTSGMVDAGDYLLTRRGRDSIIALLPGKSWPNLIDRPDAVDIRFTAGFADVAAVPEDIKAAARLLVGHFFKNREATAAGDVPQEIQLGVERLVCRYRRFAA